MADIQKGHRKLELSHDEEEEVLHLDIEVLLQAEVKHRITLLVEGTEINFLCDSGATRTIITQTDLPTACKSHKTILVRSANGRIHREPLAEPVVTAPMADMMTVIDLHCTMYYRCALGADKAYEAKFLGETGASITAQQVYWNTMGMVEAFCVLPATMLKLYRSHNVPHISLAKPNDMLWRDVGTIRTTCECSAAEWVRQSPTTLFNPISQ